MKGNESGCGMKHRAVGRRSALRIKDRLTEEIIKTKMAVNLRSRPWWEKDQLLLDVFDHAGFLRALAHGFVEDLFAEAQVPGRGFHIFVDVDVFQGAFERELHGRRK